MARFFIDRPVFSWVIAIMTMFIGLLAVATLPVAQYPEIAPPKINISAFYPGADAQTIEDTVTQVIEQNINGLDGYRYMESSSTSEGSVSINVTFNQGVDPDIAQVQLQNKIQQALNTLPAEVQQQGVRVQKTSGSFFLIASFYSTDRSLSEADIADFMVSTVQDPLSRVDGVGEIMVFGSSYAMRVWLDPLKLHKYNMTPTDVVRAIQEENVQVAFGQIGAPPVTDGQEINFTVTSQTKLESVEEFNQIQLRVNPDGSQVFLSDVARMELGAESSAFSSHFNGLPASAVALNLASGANALDTAKLVREELKKIEPLLPPGVEYAFPYDTTPFVEISVKNVVKTLFEAIILVFAVMYLFLRNFRATIIPTLAIPVVLLGTMAVLSAFGFIINTLTLFAMVLSIGLLVDDAIVVVENVERIMEEEGLSPLEATRKSMDQITGALIGIGVVLSAVFVPMAFLGGASGIIYRQFSVTIITALLLSVVVAIIFTPPLCATMLLPHGEKKEHKGIVKFILTLLSPLTNIINRFVDRFNQWFDRTNKRYEKGVRRVVRKPKRYLVLFAVIFVTIMYGMNRLPTSFLPDEDQGMLIGMAIGTDNMSLDRMNRVLDEVTDYVVNEEQESIEAITTVGGFSFSGRGGKHGIFFTPLRDWDERTAPHQQIDAIAARLQAFGSTVQGADIYIIQPPPIIELGAATGIEFNLQNAVGLSHEEFMGVIFQFMGALGQGSKTIDMGNLIPGGSFDAPQYQIDIDREKARALQVSIQDINNTLAIGWGSLYVNDFIDRGRVKKVIMQGDSEYRMQPEDFNQWYVRNRLGEMVPFSAFASGRWSSGPPQLDRFNGYPSFKFTASTLPGYSTGEAMAEVEAIVDKYLPPGIRVEWVGMSYEEIQTGNIQMALFAVSILVIFLSLAALYESWSIPLAVLLTIPVGVIGAIIAGLLLGLSNDVYFQVGMLTTIGLTGKNAILIVEFARDLMRQGMSVVDATVEAAHLRLRPILMTSLAFGLGVLPLALSSGAGSGAQNVVGITVVGGMIGGTFLVIFFAPIFFRLIVGKRTKI